mgnify:FL=1
MAADARLDPIASPSLGTLGWYAEVAPNVAPASPVVTHFRRTGGGFELRKDAYDSAEINPNRMTADSRHGVRRSVGDVDAELSVQSYDAFWEALLGGTWSTGVTLTGGGADFDSLAANGTTNVLTYAGLVGEHGLQFGDRIEIANAAEPDLNGQWTVVAASASNVTVAEDLPTASADTGGTLTVARLGKRLTIGNNYRTFGFEEALGGIAQFQLFSGVKANTAEINLPPTGMATVKWTFVGQEAGPMTGTSIYGDPPVAKTQADYGTLTFNAAARTITRASGDFTATFDVGDQFRFTGASFTLQHLKKILTVLAVSATVITVAETIEGGTAAAYTMTRIAKATYLPAPQTSVLAASSGVLMVDGEPIGTVTGLQFTIDNGISGSPVVGSNTIPQLVWGARQSISGRLTALLQEGGIYAKFEGEIEGNVLMRLDDPDGHSLQFAFPTCKFNSAQLDRSAAEGIPITVDVVAIQGRRADCEVTDVVITSV